MAGIVRSHRAKISGSSRPHRRHQGINLRSSLWAPCTVQITLTAACDTFTVHVNTRKVKTLKTDVVLANRQPSRCCEDHSHGRGVCQPHSRPCWAQHRGGKSRWLLTKWRQGQGQRKLQVGGDDGWVGSPSRSSTGMEYSTRLRSYGYLRSSSDARARGKLTPRERKKRNCAHTQESQTRGYN